MVGRPWPSMGYCVENHMYVCMYVGIYLKFGFKKCCLLLVKRRDSIDLIT